MKFYMVKTERQKIKIQKQGVAPDHYNNEVMVTLGLFVFLLVELVVLWYNV